MIVHSKFRTAVITKNILGFGLAILMLVICIVNAFEDGKINYRGTAFFVGIVTMFFFLTGLHQLFLLARIRLTPEAIENKTVLLEKTTVLPYCEITKIELSITRSQSKGGYINDGYPVSSITYKNGQVLVISSDCYENYTELMRHINYQYGNLHDV
ncbi:hypothetical protein [Flavobacterium silvaticum]|uniref:Uncharacterized protein n=1 Tax=Flavobacterium silvaticum TaxID=1852020 RepID=A0A972JGS9_9FLAO|nr:hypothetical protein [Flavobacterium silvaticum]NMH29354.1 hypothetical protein [Flavobacterium silvaticum]